MADQPRDPREPDSTVELKAVESKDDVKSPPLQDVAIDVSNVTNRSQKGLSVMVRNDTQYNYFFEDVQVSVSVPKWMPAFATPGVPGQTKQILKGINGRVSSGQVLAIIGASGSGKTTLLDQLSRVPLMPGGEMSGRISVNGEDLDDNFFKAHCAYVHQDDRLWGALTVYENLENAVSLYNPGLTEAERKKRIDNVLDATGLVSCKNTKVGNVLIKGVSGGQRRRVSIAVELMGSPAMLFLDEPTSGLDSKSAAEIMELLGNLAKQLNVMIICSIHQPSSRTFLAFDLCLLLSRGKVAYFGSANQALTYFSNLGYKAPQQMNPADYMIEISNPDFTSQKQVDDIIGKWDKNWEGMEKEHKELASPKPNRSQAKSKREGKEDSQYAASYPWQVFVLCQRMFKSYTRDPGAYIGRAVLYTMMSIIFGIIYLGAREKNQENVLNILFAIAWGMATPSYMAVMIMPVFTYESATFTKESKNGMYAPISYVVASSVVQLFFVFVTSALSVIPYYWMDDLNRDPGRFFLFLLLQYSFLYTVESISIVAATVIPNFIISLGVVVSLLSNFFVFNGLFVTPDDVPWIFRWIEYISPHSYAMKGLAKLVFSGQEFSGFEGCTVACYGATGDDVLDSVQGLSSNVDIGLMFGILWIETFVLRSLHWYLLRNK
mmetsp:Transcript_7412/g.18059  ORF Transcript_7412/g.18059 Transcript_7412/m.18059 type:complete len:662 (-) Transcript_7412:356-2341(-)